MTAHKFEIKTQIHADPNTGERVDFRRVDVRRSQR